MEGSAQSSVVDEARKVKDSWYSLYGLLESLANFSSADDEFRKVLELSKDRARAIEKKLSNLATNFKRYNPGLKEAVDEKASPLHSGLSEFSAALAIEIDSCRSFIRAKEGLENIEKELEGIREEYREVEGKVALICNKYFQRKNEYRIASEKINRTVRGEIEELERYFLERAEGISKEYSILLDGDEVRLKGLFNALVEDPTSTGKLELRRKKPKSGLLSLFKGEDIEPEEKLVVLSHLCEEVARRAKEAKKRESSEAEGLRVEFADLDSAEKACSDIENRRRELEDYSRELKERAEKLKRGRVRDYSDYNQILEAKSSLEQILLKREDAMRGLYDFIENNMEGVELEPEPEKRRLKIRLKELEKELEVAKAEMPSLREKLREMEKELGKISKEKSKREEELERLKKELEKHRSENREKIERLRKKIGELEDERNELIEDRDSKAKRIKKMENIKEKLKNDMKELFEEV